MLADWTLPLVALVAVAAVMALAGMFALVTGLLSAVGGWGRIARAYPGRPPTAGRRLAFQSGMVGPVSYRNVLTVVAADEGLHVSVAWPFRVGHPDLFLPWSALHHPRRRRLLWWDLVTVDVGDPPVGRISLPATAFDGRPQEPP
jgi:hypothetical protein